MTDKRESDGHLGRPQDERADEAEAAGVKRDDRATAIEHRADDAEALAELSRSRIEELEGSERFLQVERQIDAFQRSRFRYIAGMAIALAMAALTLWIVNQDQRRIEASSEKARLAVLQNCIRSNINSAVIKGSATRPRPGQTAKEHRGALALAKNLYPIIDCKRTEEEERPVFLSDRETRRYVGLVYTGRAPIVKDSRVIGSRLTLLEGVESVEDVGEK